MIRLGFDFNLMKLWRLICNNLRVYLDTVYYWKLKTINTVAK